MSALMTLYRPDLVSMAIAKLKDTPTPIAATLKTLTASPLGKVRSVKMRPDKIMAVDMVILGHDLTARGSRSVPVTAPPSNSVSELDLQPRSCVSGEKVRASIQNA